LYVKKEKRAVTVSSILYGWVFSSRRFRRSKKKAHMEVCLFFYSPFLDIGYFLGASVVAGFAGAGSAFFSAAGAPFAFVGALFFSAGAAVSFAGAAVVAGDAGAAFCCAVATATKATNVSKLTIRTILFILYYLLF
jgi:hypothetical protein